MPSLVFMLEGTVVKEVDLEKTRTTLGRRPNNDIVIENLPVSGEHAAFHLQGQVVEVEDLHSTNGTFVNGQPARRQALRDGDLVIIGKYEVRFVQGAPAAPHAPEPVPEPAARPPAPAEPPAAGQALVRVLTGPGAGRELVLTKVVTTLGKPGEAVASISHRPHGYLLAQVDGTAPSVNGQAITQPRPLQPGDRIVLGDTQMEFLLR
jgi:hypothetical protein